MVITVYAATLRMPSFAFSWYWDVSLKK